MSELVCILCPTGCRLRVRAADDLQEIRGAACERGREYALSELTQPVRTFTGTVRVSGGTRPVVPVKSDRPIPRAELLAAARVAARTTARAPLSMGDAIASAALPGGARLVATAQVDTETPDSPFAKGAPPVPPGTSNHDARP